MEECLELSLVKGTKRVVLVEINPLPWTTFFNADSLFYPEEGDSTILQNDSTYLPNYMTSYHREEQPS